MPTLDELQRQWLDLAVQNKGRFTRKAAIEKDWENYRRRRDKAVANAAGLPANDPTKKLVDGALKSADQLAKDGKFADAYKALAQAKTMAKSASIDRAKTVSYGSIISRLDTVENKQNMQAMLGQEAILAYQSLLNRINQLKPCSAQPDFDSAVRRHKQLVDIKTQMWAELLTCEAKSTKVDNAIRADKVGDTLKEIAQDIAVHKTAGHEQDVARHEQRMQRLEGIMNADNRRYASDTYWVNQRKSGRSGYETGFSKLMDISMFDGPDGTTDGLTDKARSGLKNDPSVRKRLEQEEKNRLEQAKQVWQTAWKKDTQVLSDTSAPDVARAPELRQFDAGDMIEDLVDDVFKGKDFPENPAFGEAKELVTKSRQKMKAILSQLDAKGPEMLDLMTKSPEKLALMCGEQLLPGIPPKNWTERQKAVIDEMGRELRAEINASCPNKMKSDGSEITIGGKTYTLVGQIGEGGNGKVFRFTDGTNTVVVKSMAFRGTPRPQDVEHAFNAMGSEMKTHRQMQEGVLAEGLPMDNLAGMVGGAVDETGKLHMVLEDIDGGDLETLGVEMSMLTDLGVLPDDARKAVTVDFLVQATRGLKAMQDVGLVNNDVKNANVMITRDGKVKVIDFGESRFVDDKGQAPGPDEGGFMMTQGFASPELEQRDKKVDGKSDNYALSKIMRTALDRNADSTQRNREVKPTGVLGELTALMEDDDPTKRPSLEAVLMSSALSQQDQPVDPDTLKALQKQAMETSRALKGLKVPVDKKEGIANAHHSKIVADTRWAKAFSEDTSDTPLLSMSTIVAMCGSYDMLADSLRKQVAEATKDSVQELRDQLKIVTAKQKFWTDLSGRALKEQRDVGRDEIDKAEKDDKTIIDVPGEGGGKMTVKAAVALRKKNEAAIQKLQDDFYEFAEDNPEAALLWVDQTNKKLLALDKQNQSITDAITALLGPAGKYVMAETKLVELSRPFGGGARDTGRGEERGEEPETFPPLPPLPDGQIPDPPKMPGK